MPPKYIIKHVMSNGKEIMVELIEQMAGIERIMEGLSQYGMNY